MTIVLRSWWSNPLLYQMAAIVRARPLIRTTHSLRRSPYRFQSNQPRNMASLAKTKSLDHLVLTVKDLEATVIFYEEILGMQHTSFSPPATPDVKRHALSFGSQKINLHVSGKEFDPKARVRVPCCEVGVADYSRMCNQEVPTCAS